ncbi:hypothetical protein CAT723_00170 [Corynebacterium ammoniagenes]|uniref:Uncharacterized protein n=1 Tax=Corynebacterium ammoniagenes TaxID=1697 RepID=A0AAV5G4H4_CORAM|nr:hypothetical protein CAT723_00170 [Corynebacterium ammoniagenes]
MGSNPWVSSRGALLDCALSSHKTPTTALGTGVFSLSGAETPYPLPEEDASCRHLKPKRGSTIMPSGPNRI